MKQQLVLQKTSSKIKSVVLDLSEKVNQQELILESLDNETKKNSSLMIKNLHNFEKLLVDMNKDPRNKIILFLIVIIFILSIYLYN
ncbi:uncharacterized protein VNE69_07165 [Vairimorpha necatrix]|uniref:Membrane protein n=1 Tax=Vairimorpha necatrix TaxID=6039 RepID=A0AAX4JDL2_9MICR